MAEEEVLIKVEVDQTASLAELSQTEQAITDIEQAQEQLNKAQAEGKITSDQYKNSRQSLDAQLNSAKGTQKNLTDSLKSQNQQLTDGVGKHKALGSEVKNLGKEVTGAKKSTDAFGAGLDKYGGALDQFGAGAGGAIKQVQGLTKASLTFLATPIGAIIGAIVAVLGTLAAYFKNTGDGADKFAKIMAQISSVMDVLIDRVSAFGRGVFNILTGNFSEGFKQIGDSVKGVGDEMSAAVEVAGELADELDRLEDAEKDYQVTASKTRNEIRLLEVQAKDRTKSESDRAALLQKALNKEIELNKQLTKIRQDQLAATVKEVGERANMQQQADETLQQFADRLVANEKLSDDLRDKVRDGIKALNEVEGESLVFQEKIQDKRNKLLDEDAAKRKKIADDRAKEQDKIAKEESKKETENIKARNETLTTSDAELKKDLTSAEEAFAKTKIGIDQTIVKGNQDAQDAITGYLKFSVNARKLINSDEFKEVAAAFNATADLAKNVMGSITKIREEEAQQQIDTITLQTQAELALIEGGYEDEIAALDAKFKSGEISEEEYNTSRKKLDTEYKDSKNRIEQQAAYDQEQIKKKAFEDNKKIRIADSIIDAVQSGLAAFRSLAPIPFVGPALGAVAAAAALAFGYKQVDLIRNQQFVGSGAQPPSAPPSLDIPATNLSSNIDGGIVKGEATDTVNGRLPGPAPVVNAAVSVVEINEAQASLAAKVAVAETTQ